MKSETRANVIFVVVLLCLMVPGVTIVLRRVYKNGGREFMPPPVRSQLSYLDTTPQWTALPRVVPPGIASFVGRLADHLATMQHGLQSIVRQPDFVPVLSDSRRIQLIGKGSDGQNYHVALVGWTSKFYPIPELYTFNARHGAQNVVGTLTGYEQKNLPLELRTELQDYGFILPPGELTWMIVSFPGGEPVDTVELTFKSDTDKFDERVSLVAPPTTVPATNATSNPGTLP